MNKEELKKLIRETAMELVRSEQKSQKKQAVIVDNNDPDENGRVKIRVSGVHPTDLPEDQLPWVQLKPELGANMGQGSNVPLRIGQFVEVESLTSGLSEFIITGGSTIIREGIKGLSNEKSVDTNNAQNNKDDDGKEFSFEFNKVLDEDFIPKIATTNLDRLIDTVYSVVESKLINIGQGISNELPKWIDTINNIKDQLQDIKDQFGNLNLDKEYKNNPNILNRLSEINYSSNIIYKIPYVLVARDVELRANPCYYYQETNLGNFSDRYFFTGFDDIEKMQETGIFPPPRLQASPEYTIIELVNKRDIKGYDFDGNVVYPEIKNRNLIIPPNIYYGENSTDYLDYELEYKIYDITNTDNFGTGIIRFRVSGKDYKISDNQVRIFSEENQEATTSSSGKRMDIKIKEFPPESTEGKTSEKTGIQYPSGIAIEIDGTPEKETYHSTEEFDKSTKRNANYSIKHPEGSRIEFFDDGRSIIKSKASAQVLTEQNLIQHADLDMEIDATNTIRINSTDLLIKVNNIVIIADTMDVQVPNTTWTGDIDLSGTLSQIGDGAIIDKGKVLHSHCHPAVCGGTGSPC